MLALLFFIYIVGGHYGNLPDADEVASKLGVKYPSHSIVSLTCNDEKIGVLNSITDDALEYNYMIASNVTHKRMFITANYYYDIEYACTLHKITKLLPQHVEVYSVLLKNGNIFGLVEDYNVFTKIYSLQGMHIRFLNDTHIGFMYNKSMIKEPMFPDFIYNIVFGNYNEMQV